MTIHSVRISGRPNGDYLGYVTAKIKFADFEFCLRGMRIIRGTLEAPLRLAMPSVKKRDPEGKEYFEEMVYPLTKQTRDALEQAVFAAYKEQE